MKRSECLFNDAKYFSSSNTQSSCTSAKLKSLSPNNSELSSMQTHNNRYLGVNSEYDKKATKDDTSKISLWQLKQKRIFKT
jgi:hypothetical protein